MGVSGLQLIGRETDVALLYEVIRRQLNLVWQIFRADICYQMSEAQVFPSRKQGTLIFFFLFVEQF